MDTKIERLEDAESAASKMKLTISVPADEFESAIDAAFRKIAREVRVPGFRPGKAPRRILEKQFGVEPAREQALKDALPEYYVRAVEEHAVDVIAPPEIDITAGEEEGDVVFDAVVEVRPEVRLTGYNSLTVDLPGIAVTDEDVDEQLESLRERFADLEDSDAPLTDGDYASIDLATTLDGEPLDALSANDYLYAVGSGRIIAELDTQLGGAKPGDILEFSAALPEGDFEGSGEEARFRVLVKEAKRKVLPNPTDEWVGEVTEFETLDEFRAATRERIGRMKRIQAQMALQEKALEELIALVPIPAPETLVNQELERRVRDFVQDLSQRGVSLEDYLSATGTEQTAFVAELRGGAEKGVLADLALRAVAAGEGIEADDAEIDAEIARMADQMGDKPHKVRKQLERHGAMGAVRSDVIRGKALRFLVDSVEVVDEEGNPLDLEFSQEAPSTEDADTEDADTEDTDTEENDTEENDTEDQEKR